MQSLDLNTCTLLEMRAYYDALGKLPNVPYPELGMYDMTRVRGSYAWLLHRLAYAYSNGLVDQILNLIERVDQKYEEMLRIS